MPVIEDLVHQVDTNVEDITELRVFRLRYADAQETADLLTSLFADNNTTSNNTGFRGAVQFGGRFGGPGGFGGRGNTAAATGDQSQRLLKQSKVVAVADLRTGSVVVSAARDLMQSIGKMIAELDSDAAKKQQVFVFDVQNTDPQAALDVLQSVIPAPLTGNNSSSSRMNSRGQNGAGNQLNNRATQNQNGRGGNSTGFGGGSGMGGGFGGGSGIGR